MLLVRAALFRDRAEGNLPMLGVPPDPDDPAR
jgi:hypothetical protein